MQIRNDKKNDEIGQWEGEGDGIIMEQNLS